MIDIEKMKALAAFADRLRVEDTLCKHGGFTEEADLIYALLSELEQNRIDQLEAQGAFEEMDRENNGLRAARIAYASEFESDAEGLPDTGNIHTNIRKLKAELKAREADRRDAERYRALRVFGKDGVNMKPPVEHVHAIIYSHQVGMIPASRVATGDELDRALDAALAQRQGEEK
ncbi:TPA: hypothetical protein QDC06_000840 [Burkholderia cepacia]|nr:hypothetical protein BZY94_00940 [Burkholderia territorii]HDR9497638.1 hypothetical protein [Burkholderia cepacia]